MITSDNVMPPISLSRINNSEEVKDYFKNALTILEKVDTAQLMSILNHNIILKIFSLNLEHFTAQSLFCSK